MNSDAALQKVYREWHRLAEAEGEAIRAGNWTAVADCQRAMEQLQPRILACAEQARNGSIRSGADPAVVDQNLRATINELIELERRNNALLELARRSAHTQLAELSEADRTLRRVQRSYAPKPAAAWTSFS